MTKRDPVDVVVVGMGVVGTILAKELAATGLRIVGLERGRMPDTTHEFAFPHVHDELKYDRHNEQYQNLARETLTFRNAISETALPMREMGSFKLMEGVGGAGVYWGASVARFLPWDFQTRSRTIERYGKDHIPKDCTSQDWGITYDELEPYYDQFENIYGIGGRAGNLEGVIQPGGNPFEGMRSREFPNQPAPTSYAGSLFAEAAASMGYHPFQSATGTMTDTYTNPYRVTMGACTRGGYCAGFNCGNGAKASPLTAVLPSLLKHDNFELRTHANVLKVNMDSDGKRATGVTYIDVRGRTVEQPADLVILASYAFNNTRLMLLSGIGAPYDPVANRGVVGRNYSYQVSGKVQLFFEDKSFKQFMGGGGVSTVIDDFNGDNFDHTGLGFIGGALVSVGSSGATPIRAHPVPDGTPPWGEGWKEAVAKYYDRTFSINSQGACQSYRNCYLDLDPNYRDAFGLPLLRLTFDWQENEQKLSAFVTTKSAEIARAMGPSKISANAKSGKYTIAQYQSTHNQGGVVMGDDPATSAVNKYLQSWDVSNVFVAGASAFPQNSANHPTSTVGALTCWAADAIKDQYLKRPGPMA